MAILESVKLLINKGVIVSREMMLKASVMKLISIRLTEKFQGRFLSTIESTCCANLATYALNSQRMRR